MKRRFISDRKILAGFLATASLCLTFAPAHAQFAEMFRDTQLSPKEVSAAQQAGNMLFDAGDPKVGQAVKWRNETSGAYGRAEIKSKEENGRCVVVEHSLSAGPDSPVEVLQFRRCVTAEGGWKLEP